MMLSEHFFTVVCRVHVCVLFVCFSAHLNRDILQEFFTFAICRCLSVVCNVRAPYSGD